MKRAHIEIDAIAIITNTQRMIAPTYSFENPFISYSDFCPPHAIIEMPEKETKMAIISILLTSSFKINEDRTATANGEVDMITVPIERGRILNTYVSNVYAIFPVMHLIARGSSISCVIP